VGSLSGSLGPRFEVASAAGTQFALRMVHDLRQEQAAAQGQMFVSDFSSISFGVAITLAVPIAGVLMVFSFLSFRR
jgi:hypothetical protein